MNYVQRITILATLYCSFLCSFPALSQQAPGVHDPVLIKQNDTYYLFCTGNGITTMSSKDLKTWIREPQVFAVPPSWIVNDVPGFRGQSLWAPDISFHNGKYYLYYSCSTFGKNGSAIGVATNTTLNPKDPLYQWKDNGRVVQSVAGRDLWNAIDPNLIVDDEGTPWLCFGSFWEGLKIVKLNPDMLSVAEPPTWATVASRSRDATYRDASPANGAIEAPFIFKKGSYYYLFVSFDYCCKGINSNYKIAVGRSAKVNGPYLDREGKKMSEGGGTLVLAGNETYPGVGHSSTYTFDGKDYLFAHAYNATANGRSELLMREITWDSNGWPKVDW